MALMKRRLASVTAPVLVDEVRLTIFRIFFTSSFRQYMFLCGCDVMFYLLAVICRLYVLFLKGHMKRYFVISLNMVILHIKYVFE